MCRAESCVLLQNKKRQCNHDEHRENKDVFAFREKPAKGDMQVFIGTL